MSKKIDMASRVYRNLGYPRAMPAGGKYSATSNGLGGGWLISAPTLRGFGYDVALLGRNGRGDATAADFANSYGIEWRMRLAKAEEGGVNVLIDQDRILRVLPPPPYEPSRADSLYLARSSARAMALTGSMDGLFTEFWADQAAALRKRLYWNAGGDCDIGLACIGEVYLQVSFAEFGLDGEEPGETASRLQEQAAAMAVIVTHANGADAVFSTTCKYSVKRIDVAESTTVGAGDAFFGAFIAAFEDSNSAEQALGVARTVAARHVAGYSPLTGKRDLLAFEASCSDVAKIGRTSSVASYQHDVG